MCQCRSDRHAVALAKHASVIVQGLWESVITVSVSRLSQAEAKQMQAWHRRINRRHQSNQWRK
jgi:hypothetical protein